MIEIRLNFISKNEQVISINEMKVETLAKAQKWVESEIKVRRDIKKVQIIDTDGDILLGNYIVSINYWEWLE